MSAFAASHYLGDFWGCVCPRAALECAYSREDAGIRMPQFPPLVDSRIVRPTETARALELVTDLELLRLKTLARWYARGLPPDVTWEDLLQEALTRILVGKRQVPQGVVVVAFVAGVMRSLRSEHWQRVDKVMVRGRRRWDPHPKSAHRQTELVESAPGPERALIAQQELAAIRNLFAEDAIALMILGGLAQGLTAEEIRLATGLSDIDYASARKRMRRVLLREGLTCAPK
jgi:DNA-directed RNA polymerase specialized sigma24 family protein